MEILISTVGNQYSITKTPILVVVLGIFVLVLLRFFLKVQHPVLILSDFAVVATFPSELKYFL